MRLKDKAIIEFLYFFKEAKFDYIKLGQTKDWILNNFPDPDNFNHEFLSPNFRIWTYGNIEFHFDKDNSLCLIYSDCLADLEGGESLELKKWILDKYTKLNLLYVLKNLNKNNIDYCKQNNNMEVIIIMKCGVEIGFSNNRKSDNLDQNRLHMAYFSLNKRQHFVIEV